MNIKTFHSEADLVSHLKTHAPTFYHSAKTSTVIPYDKIQSELDPRITIADLSKMPTHLELTQDNTLILRGGVSWEEANHFLKGHGRAIMTSPTEQLASVTAGVATSCTGERCFSFGNLRTQIRRLKYFNHEGKEIELHARDPFGKTQGLEAYQEAFKRYAAFKNAPFPRFETATDLMIGTEGQLGVVSEVEIETIDDFPAQYLFLLLPRWEKNIEAHLEIFERVQAYRREIISCELLDANCLAYLPEELRPGENEDCIFLEIKAQDFEKIYVELILPLTLTPTEKIFEMTKQKFHQVRAGVPRAVFEANSKMGVKKMGTDCQVTPEKFSNLLHSYRRLAQVGVKYNLFGHFGDAHLHYNYMPTPTQIPACTKAFEELYHEILQWHGSPFAEHGIGLLKQKYIKPFYSVIQEEVFSALKKQHDPHSQFFPGGYMRMAAKHTS